MFIIGLILILALFLFLLVNTGASVRRWLKECGCRIKPLIFWLVFGGLTALVLALFILGRGAGGQMPRWLLLVGHDGLGVFVYTLLFVNLVALALLVGRWTRLVRHPRPAGVSLTALLLCGALVVDVSAYGLINARTVRTVPYTVTAAAGKSADNMKIALISDLHIGHIVDDTHLSAVVEEINAMQPDVVCVAGDVFDGDMTAIARPEAVKEVLRSIDAPHGVYACLGNHDAGEGYGEMLAFLADAGVRVLVDEYAVIDGRMILVGRRDSSPIGERDGERAESVLLPSDTTLPVVVLDHQPKNITQYDASVDLILCGHTHRGQIFPVNVITGLIYDVDYGYYRASPTSPQVIVTSGVGTWGPTMRVGSNCEVVEIVLK